MNEIEKPSSLTLSVFDSNHTQNMEQHRGRGRPPGSKMTLPVDPKNRKRTKDGGRKVRDVEHKTYKYEFWLIRSVCNYLNEFYG